MVFFVERKIASFRKGGYTIFFIYTTTFYCLFLWHLTLIIHLRLQESDEKNVVWFLKSEQNYSLDLYIFTTMR